MPRPFTMPDPNDRSVNEPSVIVSSTQILGLYNQENKTDKKERVVDGVKDWYETRAKNEGWNNVHYSGSQVVLTAKVSIQKDK